MTTRKIAIDVPESVLLAEKTDERAFARELRMLAAVKLYELGPSFVWPGCGACRDGARGISVDA